MPRKRFVTWVAKARRQTPFEFDPANQVAIGK